MSTLPEALIRLSDRVKPRMYLWIALVVMIPRLLFIVVAPGRSIYGNAPGLLAVARNIAEGRGYLDEEGQPDSYFNPGYPVFLVACRSVGGQSLLPIKLAQVALDIGTALALAWLLQDACSVTAAILFGVMFGLHPLFIHLNNNINDEPLLTFLVVVSLVVLYRALRRPSWWQFAASALLAAAATYTKGTPILLPFGVAGALVILGRKANYGNLPYWILYVAVFVGALTPWAYRNHVVFGRFAFSVRGFGTNLEWGSDPRIFTDYGQTQRQAAIRLEDEMKQKGVLPPRENTVFEREQFRLRVAIARYREMLHTPAMFAKVLALKAMRTLYATEDRPSIHPFIVGLQIPTIILAVGGLFQLWRSTKTRLLASVLTAYVLYYYSIVAAGMPMIRYFMPAMPLLLVAAAVRVSTWLVSHSNPADHPGQPSGDQIST